MNLACAEGPAGHYSLDHLKDGHFGANETQKLFPPLDRRGEIARMQPIHGIVKIELRSIVVVMRTSGERRGNPTCVESALQHARDLRYGSQVQTDLVRLIASGPGKQNGIVIGAVSRRDPLPTLA